MREMRTQDSVKNYREFNRSEDKLVIVGKIGNAAVNVKQDTVFIGKSNPLSNSLL